MFEEESEQVDIQRRQRILIRSQNAGSTDYEWCGMGELEKGDERDH